MVMPCQCKACLDRLASPEWLWFHEQQHHVGKNIIFVCPHCDTALPPKNKNTPSDQMILTARSLKCPSCSRQEHPFLFVRRQTAFACGFCSKSFHASSSPITPSSSASAVADSTAAGKASSSSPNSNSGSCSGPSSDSLRQAGRRYFAHLARELLRNDKLTKQGKPPREWSHTKVIHGLLQRPGIVKHWEALFLDSNNDSSRSSMCKVPPRVNVILVSWNSGTVMPTTDGMLGTNLSLKNQLQFFDLEKDGDEKAAWLAKLAYEQAEKTFQSQTGGVVAKQHQAKDTTTCVGVGNKDHQEDRKKKSNIRLDKPLPKVPTLKVATAASQTVDFAYLTSTASTAATSSSSSSSAAQQPQGLKSTDYRMNRDSKRRENGDSKARRKVRTIVKQIEMALAAAYC